MNQVLFPEVFEKKIIPPNEDTTPYFLYAYWPTGGYWSIKEWGFDNPDGDEINRTISRLSEKGWTHVTILKLPDCR